MPTERNSYDLILAGGGLANGLIAWRLRTLRPDLRVLLLEADSTLGGNHTWSFHDGDVSAEQREWLMPFVMHHWPGHAVLFRGRARWLPSGYNSITSTRFHDALMHTLNRSIRLNTPVVDVRPTRVICANGENLHAAAVIDGRGFRSSAHLRLRYQKFVGLELRLAKPHLLTAPILMDARVAQHDGYRFVYVLPLDTDRLLIEDTYYADTSDLVPSTLRARALSYTAGQCWEVVQTLREENGVLPLTLDGDIDGFWSGLKGQPCSGMRAGLFHPTTGYSLPQAVRLADFIATQTNLSAPALAAAIEQHARRVWRSQAFFRALNRMLFLAAAPEARERVLSHFYRLPDRLVSRFYGERLSMLDKLRIVSGKPPVPLSTAMKALFAPRMQEVAA